MVDIIINAMPMGGMIVSSLAGRLQTLFFQHLHATRVNRSFMLDKYVILSFNVHEQNVASIGAAALEGHYTVANSFSELDSPEYVDFAARYLARFGNTVISDEIVTAYTSVQFYVLGVQLANSLDPQDIRRALYGVTWTGPLGKLTLNPNNHLSKSTYLAKILNDGSFSIVHGTTVRNPEPWSWLQSETQTLSCDWSPSGMGGNFTVPVIRVGVLHSTSGDMASVEIPVLEATRLAIQELNNRGGVLGRRILPEYSFLLLLMLSFLLLYYGQFLHTRAYVFPVFFR